MQANATNAQPIAQAQVQRRIDDINGQLREIAGRQRELTAEKIIGLTHSVRAIADALLGPTLPRTANAEYPVPTPGDKESPAFSALGRLDQSVKSLMDGTFLHDALLDSLRFEVQRLVEDRGEQTPQPFQGLSGAGARYNG